METITVYEYRLQQLLEAFEDALDQSGLRYRGTQLYQYGFTDERSILRAINRAIRLCRGMAIDSRKHFRPYYLVDAVSGETFRDWRISRMGFYLVLCNGDADNPYVGALQYELIKRFSEFK